MSDTVRYEYTTYWLFKRRPDWIERVHTTWESARDQLAGLLSNPGDGVTIRGTYVTLAFREDADLMIWAHAENVDALSQLAVKIDQTAIGRSMNRTKTMLGVGGMSQYDKTHGPAFMQGKDPLRFMSCYPFIKSPAWYQLPYEERRRLMIEHGQMGRDYPDVVTNTTNSFGVQDQEFIVALEGNTPNEIIVMSQKLREAEVREYTVVDTPIWLGERMEPSDAIEAIRG